MRAQSGAHIQSEVLWVATAAQSSLCQLMTSWHLCRLWLCGCSLSMSEVAHQVYPHKILTGRRKRIYTLRQGGGQPVPAAFTPLSSLRNVIEHHCQKVVALPRSYALLQQCQVSPVLQRWQSHPMMPLVPAIRRPQSVLPWATKWHGILRCAQAV